MIQSIATELQGTVLCTAENSVACCLESQLSFSQRRIVNISRMAYYTNIGCSPSDSAPQTLQSMKIKKALRSSPFNCLEISANSPVLLQNATRVIENLAKCSSTNKQKVPQHVSSFRSHSQMGHIAGVYWL